MHQSYNNQQQLPVHTQSYGPGYNPESAINLSTPQILSSTNVGEHQWKHYLSNIPAHVTGRLTMMGMFYIVIGILNIGLEIRLLTNDYFSYLIGFLNGYVLFIVGILIIILCRQQVYVLSNLFVAVFFQLFLTVASFIGYSILFSYVNHSSSDCTHYGINCGMREGEIILIVDMIHCFVTFCLAVANLSTISNARRLPNIPVTSTYIVYNPQPQPMHTSFQNPSAMTMNQSSSA